MLKEASIVRNYILGVDLLILQLITPFNVLKSNDCILLVQWGILEKYFMKY